MIRCQWFDPASADQLGDVSRYPACRGNTGDIPACLGVGSDHGSRSRYAAAWTSGMLGLGAPTSYVERLIAVLFQFPPEPSGAAPATAAADSGVGVRALLPRSAGVRHDVQKTGEQVSLPVRWNAQADTRSQLDEQFGEMFEQVPAAVT